MSLKFEECCLILLLGRESEFFHIWIFCIVRFGNQTRNSEVWESDQEQWGLGIRLGIVRFGNQTRNSKVWGSDQE